MNETSCDARGVSPVIGAVLMITISVLLATIVGVVVVGYTSGAIQEPPRASLDIEASTDTDEIVIRHLGGDVLDVRDTRLVVTVNGTESTFEAPTNRSVLGVGATAVVGTAGDDTLDWDGDGTVEIAGGSDELPPLSPGDAVSVRLVHPETRTTFFQTAVTA